MSDLSKYREELAEVLIRHQRIPLFDGTFGQRCVGCDSLRGETDGPNSPRHAAHLADALLPVLARVVAEAKAEGWDHCATYAERGKVLHEVEGEALRQLNPFRAEASGREGGQDA